MWNQCSCHRAWQSVYSSSAQDTTPLSWTCLPALLYLTQVLLRSAILSTALGFIDMYLIQRSILLRACMNKTTADSCCIFMSYSVACLCCNALQSQALLQLGCTSRISCFWDFSWHCCLSCHIVLIYLLARKNSAPLKSLSGCL